MGFRRGQVDGVDVIAQPLITPEFWAGKRVLLTGHTGFKGSWLALWLSELGAQVTGVGLEPDTEPHLFEQLQLERRLQSLQRPCAVVMVTTDKVYANQEWDYGYREDDCLGGHDPYSASKAAAELAIASWRSSFCGGVAHQNPHLAIATARAGHVIGGGD